MMFYLWPFIQTLLTIRYLQVGHVAVITDMSPARLRIRLPRCLRPVGVISTRYTMLLCDTSSLIPVVSDS